MSAATTIQRALALHRQGKLGQAAQIYEGFLHDRPNDFTALYYLGLVRAQEGLTEVAIALFRRALDQNPRVPEIHNNLGMALYGLRRYEDAIASYRNAISLEPRYTVAYNNLGTALGALGRHEEAIPVFEHVVGLKPDFAEALNNLGAEYLATGQYDVARHWLNQAIALRPDYAEAQVNRGNTLLALDCPLDALESYERALELRPKWLEVRVRIADLVEKLGRPEDALDHFQQAAMLAPASEDIHLRMGNLLQNLNRHREAVIAYRRVLVVNGSNFEAYDCLGSALAELGDWAGAREAFLAALRINPASSTSYFGLAHLSKVERGDSILREMETLSEHSLPDDETGRVRLLFALGKALADVGEHERSYSHYLAGNALRRRKIVYDEAATLGLFERMQAGFTRELLTGDSGGGSPSKKPVFIVGMMRSGTTLVEQILASHPLIFAAGERTDLQEVVGEELGKDGRWQLPSIGASLDRPTRLRVAAAYLQRLQSLKRVEPSETPRLISAERITDKLPANFLLIGLIRLVFPNAAIIHTYRDPVNTCLSCFCRLFANDQQPHTYELGELGRYYRSYARLMSHWRAVLPRTAMLEVSYESLVLDFASEARRIVEFTGLDWDDACLDFHRTSRPVRTASMTQVRQPIYQSSLRPWRPRHEVLRPLLIGLGSESATAE